MSAWRGRCHCGAVGFEYHTELPPTEWPVRECQCSYCRKQGACYTSDPAGSIRFVHTDASALSRYRFGHETADFVFCGRCGGYLGALTEEGGQALMVVNLRALDPQPGRTCRRRSRCPTTANRPATAMHAASRAGRPSGADDGRFDEQGCPARVVVQGFQEGRNAQFHLPRPHLRCGRSLVPLDGLPQPRERLERRVGHPAKRIDLGEPDVDRIRGLGDEACERRIRLLRSTLGMKQQGEAMVAGLAIRQAAE